MFKPGVLYIVFHRLPDDDHPDSFVGQTVCDGDEVFGQDLEHLSLALLVLSLQCAYYLLAVVVQLLALFFELLEVHHRTGRS